MQGGKGPPPGTLHRGVFCFTGHKSDLFGIEEAELRYSISAEAVTLFSRHPGLH